MMEITICLLPLALQAQVIDSLVKTLERDPLQNIPHISLFQMKIEEEKLPEIVETLKRVNQHQHQLSKDPLSFKVNRIMNKYENVALDLTPYQPTLQHQFKEEIIEAVKDLRASRLMDQIDVNILSHHQKELVTTYGIYWGVGPFLEANHLTLSYNHTLESALPVPEEIETLQVDELAIGKIGPIGNLEKIYWKEPLRKPRYLDSNED